MNKKLIEERLDPLHELVDGTSIEDCIEGLKNINESYINQGYSDITIHAIDCYDDVLYFHGMRWETDKEYARRIKAEAAESEKQRKLDAKKEERERKLLKALKKKYEK